MKFSELISDILIPDGETSAGAVLTDAVLAGEPIEVSGPNVTIAGLTADSRQVEAGFLFAGLPGVAADGARFIPKALAAGASAIVTHPSYQNYIPDDIAVIKHPDPRLVLAKLAAKYYAPLPEIVMGVTGTNGKTSVASFVRQIWLGLGINGASLGTIGVVSKSGERKLAHTTPDPVTLHEIIHELVGEGVDHLVLEASSHGLAQRRLDGLTFKAAAFTNITRDHLDYHGSFEAYFAEKKRLFSELLEPDGVAVIDADVEGADEIIDICNARMINVMTIGEQGRYLNVRSIERDGFSQRLVLQHHRGVSEVCLPLVGGFQASNALVAAALVAAGGVPLLEALGEISELRGAKGRLEWAGDKNGAPVFIDYAHTPDALATAIEALRPYVQNRLLVVFGCGGDRDKGKRAMMGEVAITLADVSYVTDDNPRGEEASQIRSEILAAAPGAIEVGDRALAIETAIKEMQPGDLLLVAGKGHETGQIVGDAVLPFSDHEVVARVLATL